MGVVGLRRRVALVFDHDDGVEPAFVGQGDDEIAMAFEKAADASFHPEAGAPFQPRALYYHTIPRGMFKVGVRMLRLFGQNPRQWGRNKDIDLVSLAEVDFPVHARIDYRAVAARKEEASNCHASQGGGQMRRGLLGMFFNLFSGTETYMRAYPLPAARMRVAKDLFELPRGQGGTIQGP